MVCWARGGVGAWAQGGRAFLRSAPSSSLVPLRPRVWQHFNESVARAVRGFRNSFQGEVDYLSLVKGIFKKHAKFMNENNAASMTKPMFRFLPVAGVTVFAGPHERCNGRVTDRPRVSGAFYLSRRGGGGQRPNKSVCTYNRPPISGPFNQFHFFS